MYDINDGEMSEGRTDYVGAVIFAGDIESLVDAFVGMEDVSFLIFALFEARGSWVCGW